ncbi:MAG: PHP domain-containing protein [Oscillospiraceae bacterium]|nr:PHP domain-containing protein [Oscillospiraceae bacterium]
MNLFKYETHAHTSEVSKCSKINAAELVQFYKNCGYDGICITDHFLNGNTTVPRDLEWAERIKLFCRGFENAYAEGKKLGISVFFGWEYSYRGTDFLTYGLSKEWLLEHPEIIDISTNEYCDLVRANGGFIVHAHPFREASYISMIRLLPRKVDAVEVINACRLDFENKLANEYANNYNLLKSAGTDNHIGRCEKLSGIQLSKRLNSVDDMISAIKNGEAEIFEEILK